MKKLYLSRSNKKIAGVLGGIEDRYDVDATVLRVITVLLALLTQVIPVVFVYVLAWIVIPREPLTKVYEA